MAEDKIEEDGVRMSLEREDDGFEAFTEFPTDGETAVPISTNYESFKKLEVVNSRQVNSMARNFNIMALLGFAASAVVIILARTTFAVVFPGVGAIPEITVFEFPKGFALVDSIIGFAMSLYSVLLLFVYCFILLTEGVENILNEQVWVIMLLVSSVVYLIPFNYVIRLKRDFLLQDVPELGEGFNALYIFAGLRTIAFSGISILYLWTGAHGYRYLDSKVSFRDWQFYAPKICIVLFYNAYKLFVIFYYFITVSDLPFASFVGFINLYTRTGVWPRTAVIIVSLLTVIELGIAAWVTFDIWKTSKILRLADYTKHRSKILGFKFFLHQQVVFFTVFVITYLALLFGLPSDIQVFLFFLEGTERNSYFDIQYAPIGLPLCVLTYTTIEAYTNLPAKVTLQNNWMMRKVRREAAAEDRRQEFLEPIFYRNKEPPSIGSGAVILPNCFIMETNIELFNLSWYSYYYGTRKESNVRMDFTASGLTVRKYLHSEKTDTNVLVLESTDRIIFAFKGTASSQNLFTDLKVTHRSLSHVIETNDEIDNALFNNVKTRAKYRRAKVHAGFAEAYGTVQGELRRAASELLAEKKRPFYFTGHSLGGALATLASLDICLATGTAGRNTVVSTFGSPRVGNRSFQEMYEGEIEMNWRFVAGGDIISRLPKLGYSHVGKQVVLTSTGQLFIDPNALEMLFWHSQSASVIHHRKSCYLLALKAWCQAQSGDYKPQFWHFPVSSHDSDRFQNSFRKPSSPPTSSLSAVFSRHYSAPPDRRAKLRQWIAQIDELDENGTFETLPLWQTLATPILASIRQHNTVGSLINQDELMSIQI